MSNAAKPDMDACDLPKPPLLGQLPREIFWENMELYQWEGFWYGSTILQSAIAFQSNFEACDDDVILASSMKTGTAWLSTLSTCIMRRHSSDDSEEDYDLLLKNYPPHSVQNFETQLYNGITNPDLSGLLSPRLFHTHLPYSFLSNSIKSSECKIVYIARNPKDTLVSLWNFLNTIRRPKDGLYPFGKAFDSFCNGVHPWGPFMDHVLQYWKESLKTPNKILFLKYEELRSDPKEQVKRLASFLGRPFSKEEEVDKMLETCSLGRLKNLSKEGSVWPGVTNSSFFRKGAIGDWKNYFTPSMTERLDQITRLKLQGSGLDL